MAVIRIQKNRNFSVISNVHLNDSRLSWKAMGILTYLLSKPDDWQVYVKHLAKQTKDGRDATYTGIQELTKCGYIIKQEVRDAKGKIRGIEYLVIENPGISDPQRPKPDTENPDTENPDTENPDTENPTLLNTDNDQIQKKTTTDSNPSPLPSPFSVPSSQPPAPKSSPNQISHVSQETIELIPEAYRKNIVIALVKNSGLPEQAVRDCILYTNNRPKKEGKTGWQAYKSHLGRTLQNHAEWCPGFEQDIKESEAESQTKSKEFAFVPDGTEVEYKGKRYIIERGGFLSTGTGCIPPASVAKAVTDGIILLC